MWFLDAARQLIGRVRPENGGTGNDFGGASSILKLGINPSPNAALAVGSLVQYAHLGDDARIKPVVSEGSLVVLGVVIGRYRDDGYTLVREAVPTSGLAAVMLLGTCDVLIGAAVTKGQYAYAHASPGLAKSSVAFAAGAFGTFEQSAASGKARVLLFGPRAPSASSVSQEGVPTVTTAAVRLDVGNGIRYRGLVDVAALDVKEEELSLLASQVFVDDVAGAFMGTGSSGVETLRPTSDVTTSGTFVYTSGSTGWNLVDEAVLVTTDYYAFQTNGAYLIHGFPASVDVVDASRRIDSVTIHADILNPAPAGAAASLVVRDPATGERYDVGTPINQNPPSSQTAVLTARPWDGTPWTLADVAHLQAGAHSDNVVLGNQLVIRQFWVTIEWSDPKTVESVLAQIVGIAGPTGPEGPEGPEGPTGVTGPAGGAQSSVTCCFDGGGVAISGTHFQDVPIPFAGTIASWSIVADVSGDIDLDLWKTSYAGFPPTIANTIVGTVPPAVTGDQKATGTDMTGWTTAIASGDILRFVINGVTDATKVVIQVKFT